MHTLFQIPNRPITPIVFSILVIALSSIAFGGLSEHLLNATSDEQDLIQDVRIIQHNPAYLISSERISPIRPTVDLVFLIAHSLWQDQPAGYHILQIVLHIIASLLLAYTFYKLGADLELSLLAGLLFCLNVAHFRAIQWVILINYIVGLIFCLITVLNYHRFLYTYKKRYNTIALIAATAAIFSHPSSVAVIPFCVYLAWKKEKAFRPTIQQSILLVAVALATTTTAFLLSPHHDQAEGLVANFSLLRIIENPLWYLGRLLSTAHWLTPAGIHNAPLLWEVGLGALGCFGAVLLFRKRIFPAVDWAIWAIIMVLPFINNGLDRLTVGPSRQLYLASAGTSFILAWALRTILTKTRFELAPKTQRIIFATCVACLVTTSIVTLKRAESIDNWLVGRSYTATKDFKTGFEQYDIALQKGPHIVPSDIYLRMATIAFSSGNPLPLPLKQALMRLPSVPELNMLQGVSFFLSDNLEEHQKGETQILRAIEKTEDQSLLKTNAAISFFNIGTHYYNSGDNSRAQKMFVKALDYQPDYALVHFNLGNTFLRQGNYSQAIETYQTAIRLQPNHAETYQNLGAIYAIQGHYSIALQTLDKAISITPTLATSWHLKAQCHRYTNNPEAAYRAIGQALALNANHSEYWSECFNIACLFEAQQKNQEALAIYQLITTNQPRFFKAFRNQGALYLDQSHYDKAIDALKKAVELLPNDKASQKLLEQALVHSKNRQLAILLQN